MFPAVLGWSVLIFGHLNYVFFISGAITSSWDSRALLLIFHTLLGGMVYWCYVMVMFTKPGQPSVDFIVSSQYHLVNLRYEFVALAGTLQYPPDCPSMTREDNLGLRYCLTCNNLKPDRTHHCNTCRQCVLRMDHHCPWIANCVGFRNHKFFFLFLSYGTMLAFFYTCSTVVPFVNFLDASIHPDKGISPDAAAGGSPGLMGSQFIFGIMFTMALSLMSLMHFFLIRRNGTSHEHHRLPRFIVPIAKKNGFDLGSKENWEMIMGVDPKYWFLPINTTRFNGQSFPVRGPDEEMGDLEHGSLLAKDLDDLNASDNDNEFTSVSPRPGHA
ncbi:hypothetical protein SARC_02724 [Sphaeroforma arctica JP610]|uniref:Palmitoyltransferase n=1 Tax=Sphaeroforma arctica JP610 TaxID=667725 RepID=A0A0L0GA38_9EUKA|nr:hypothetical protein SARC_02724 [Sphaeroforma arctica JP610]KNC85098.1 hypothetical protein SARC_02724 [Sphaeroforma arctica JP610]|eukprot:XP_014159000.1 hypothetical protein SARC_02724 [Sphaeroforma arctica JP610]